MRFRVYSTVQTQLVLADDRWQPALVMPDLLTIEYWSNRFLPVDAVATVAIAAVMRMHASFQFMCFPVFYVSRFR